MPVAPDEYPLDLKTWMFEQDWMEKLGPESDDPFEFVMDPLATELR